MFDIGYAECKKCERKFYWNIQEQYKLHKCYSEMTDEEWLEEIKCILQRLNVKYN